MSDIDQDNGDESDVDEEDAEQCRAPMIGGVPRDPDRCAYAGSDGIDACGFTCRYRP